MKTDKKLTRSKQLLIISDLEKYSPNIYNLNRNKVKNLKINNSEKAMKWFNNKGKILKLSKDTIAELQLVDNEKLIIRINDTLVPYYFYNNFFRYTERQLCSVNAIICYFNELIDKKILKI